MPRVPKVRDADLDKATARSVAFTHVDGQRLTDAPPHCGNCGGPWRPVDEGYGCVQCGRRWRAAECLMALAHLDRHDDR